MVVEAIESGRRPFVSVIVPAYNVAGLLRETADSVLAQTITDFQLIIVDDGSTDETLGVARSLADPRVEIITGTNRGRAAARNLGFSAIAPSVEFVAFLDADDLWNADKLERQISWLRERPEACAVGCAMHYISAEGRKLGRTGQAVDRNALELVRSGALLPFPISSALIRRVAVEAIGGFDPTLAEAEDRDFYAKLATTGELEFIDESLGSYRIHGASASVTRRALMDKYVRFVRARIAARRAGGDLSWEAFSASYRPTWRERRNDLVRAWYRAAALAYAGREVPRAFLFGALALLLNPGYVIRRLFNQRLRHTRIFE